MRLVGQDTIKNKIWEYYKKNKQKKLAQKKHYFFDILPFLNFSQLTKLKIINQSTSNLLLAFYDADQIRRMKRDERVSRVKISTK